MNEIYGKKPQTERELEEKYRVEFSREPRDERMVLRNPKFLEEANILNDKFGSEFSALVWLVDFLRANNKDFENPLSGLLIIPKKRWENACLNLSCNDLKGKAEIVVDKARQIKSVRNNLT
jgi:hypothetical protein